MQDVISKLDTKTAPFAAIKLPPLIRGVLVKRYNRFLADVRLLNGRIVKAHCPNPGSMKSCCEPGRRVYLSKSTNPKRKLDYTLEIIKMPSAMVGINSILPNRLVPRAIKSGHIPELAGYEKILPEIKTGEKTRLDLLLTGTGKKDCYVEIKNSTYVLDGKAMFPDAVTIRGKKHLDSLIALKKTGARAVIFYLIQREDASSFSPAIEIDPEYSSKLAHAESAGVEILAYDTTVTREMIYLRRRLPVII